MILDALKESGADVYRRTRDGIEAGLADRTARNAVFASGIGVALGVIALVVWRMYRSAPPAKPTRRRTSSSAASRSRA